MCTSWKHILRGKDLAIVFYFYTTPGFFYFFSLKTFLISKEEVCALHHPSAKRTALERHTRSSSFSSRVSYVFVGVLFCVDTHLLVGLCVRVYACVSVYVTVTLCMSPLPVLCPAQRKSHFEQSSVFCPVS